MIQKNFSLRELNTFGIDVVAKAFDRFKTVEELQQILDSNESKLPLFVLGGGSNILFTKDVDALVIKNEISGIEKVGETDETIDLKSGAGVVWHDFVMYCVDHGYGGAENLSLIPGSVGASPMQNIGAYGVEIKDFFVNLEAFEIETGKIREFTAEECAFGYRESVFKRELKGKYIITTVTFRLQKNPQFNTAYGAIQSELEAMGNPQISVRNISQAVMNIRNSKLPNPKELGNAGSFFKNPVINTSDFAKIALNHPEMPHYPQKDGEKLAAGWLIEQAGLKGKRIGNCGVHTKQALVLVNYGGATGNEIFNLSQLVLDTVSEKFGVNLEREVNIL